MRKRENTIYRFESFRHEKTLGELEIPRIIRNTKWYYGESMHVSKFFEKRGLPEKKQILFSNYWISSLVWDEEFHDFQSS